MRHNETSAGAAARQILAQRKMRLEMLLSEDVSGAYNVETDLYGRTLEADHIRYEFDRLTGRIWRNEIDITGDITGRCIATCVRSAIFHVFKADALASLFVEYVGGNKVRCYIPMLRAEA